MLIVGMKYEKMPHESYVVVAVQMMSDLVECEEVEVRRGGKRAEQMWAGDADRFASWARSDNAAPVTESRLASKFDTI